MFSAFVGKAPTYINLDNESGRKQAYDIVQKIEEQEEYVAEPINTTAAKADDSNKLLKNFLHQHVINALFMAFQFLYSILNSFLKYSSKCLSM